MTMSQESATDPYPASDESNPHPPTLFRLDTFTFHLSIYTNISEWLSPTGFPTKIA
jgi:hypothetical protein